MRYNTGEGTSPVAYTLITRDGWQPAEAEIINEQMLSIFVNAQELATVMCTPIQQDALALGFLANEGVIHSLDETELVQVCHGGTCVDVWLAFSNFQIPSHRIMTSGCGGGLTFDNLSQLLPPLETDKRVVPDLLWTQMDSLYQAAALYSRSRGVHCSALSDGQTLLLSAEDVGRHNTLDKLRGLALQQGIDTRDCILLSTGRISSEMINKARHMQAPIICSRTSPTSLSIELAKQWNITLVGYLHRNSMNIYTHPERIETAQ